MLIETLVILISSAVIAGASLTALVGEALLRWRARQTEAKRNMRETLDNPV
jgi:hypothetical protein